MRFCRHCGKELSHVFIDLGFAPPSNAYRSAVDLDMPEPYFPLKVFVCDSCWLVQTIDYSKCDELFTSDYAYFSSTSTTWLAHAKNYFNMIKSRLGLNEKSFVVELASNDGYLLRNAVECGIPCLGIEPTASTAEAARKLNVPTIERFFGEKLADELVSGGKKADLIIGNNVFAHVPDINDFTLGMKRLLKPEGTITLEFPHVMHMIKNGLFDIIYHEHYSYPSLISVMNVFEKAGLRVYDVEKLTTQGESYRIYGCHADSSHKPTERFNTVLSEEMSYGMNKLSAYSEFQIKANVIKNEFLAFLLEKNKSNRKVVAYGAAAKGNTLLNYAGVKPDLLPCIFDAAAAKQNRYMPGSHIPILPPSELANMKPDYIVILPWNIAGEVMEQLSYVKEWGGKFVTAVSEIKVL